MTYSRRDDDVRFVHFVIKLLYQIFYKLITKKIIFVEKCKCSRYLKYFLFEV